MCYAIAIAIVALAVTAATCLFPALFIYASAAFIFGASTATATLLAQWTFWLLLTLIIGGTAAGALTQ